jgi:pentatricopeptide repeat protein
MRVLPLSTYRGQLEARQVHSRGGQRIVPGSAPLPPVTKSNQGFNGNTSSSFLTTNASHTATSLSHLSYNDGSGWAMNNEMNNDNDSFAINDKISDSLDELYEKSVNERDSMSSSISSYASLQNSSSTANSPNMLVFRSISDQLENTRSREQLSHLWINWTPSDRSRLNDYDLNKFMSLALEYEVPSLAIRAFEDLCGFVYQPADPIGEIHKLASASKTKEESSNLFWATESALKMPDISKPTVKPNNFICTTVAKAYGRVNEPEKALALLPWFEQQGNAADIYFLTSLLYVCAKGRNFQQAEHLFWTEIPRRNLTYTVATINSIMYMYAKQNRPDDAMRVYEMCKRLGLQCTVVTYGVLIKALLRSGRKQLQDASYEILRSLPEVGISPGIEVYNQFLEHFSHMHDFRQAKVILKTMANAKPKIKVYFHRLIMQRYNGFLISLSLSFYCRNVA